MTDISFKSIPSSNDDKLVQYLRKFNWGSGIHTAVANTAAERIVTLNRLVDLISHQRDALESEVRLVEAYTGKVRQQFWYGVLSGGLATATVLVWAGVVWEMVK